MGFFTNSLKILSTLLFFVTDVDSSSSTALFITHTYMRFHIFNVFNLGFFIENNKKNLVFPVLIYNLIMYIWNTLVEKELFNFLNIQLASFLIFYLIGKIKNNWNKDTKENASYHLRYATSIQAFVVLILFWAIDFPNSPKGLRYLLFEKSEKSLEDYLKIINSFNIHLFSNIYWIRELFNKRNISIFGLITTSVFYFTLIILVLSFYISPRIKVFALLDNIIKSENSIENIINFNHIRNIFCRSLFFFNSYSLFKERVDVLYEGDSLETNLTADKISPIDLELNKNEVKKFLIQQLNLFSQLDVNTINIIKNNNGIKELIVSLIGYMPYPFLRLEQYQKNYQILLKPEIYILLFFPIILHFIFKITPFERRSTNSSTLGAIN